MIDRFFKWLFGPAASLQPASPSRAPVGAPSDTPLGSRESVARALQAMGNPQSWPQLDNEDLRTLALLFFIHYGRKQDPLLRPLIERLYALLVDRFSANDRLALEQTVAALVMKKETGHQALLPFILGESHHHVIASAVIDFTSTVTPDAGDPLSTIKFLLARFTEATDGSPCKLGILCGLLLLGDERLLPLLKGRWKELTSEEDRFELASTMSGFVTTLQIEFLLDWLENTTLESDIGAVAAAMARMPLDSLQSAVLRIERVFPATAAKSGEEVKKLGQWSFPEYAQIIKPRLLRLIEQESEPKVIPAIFAAWEATDETE